MVKDNSEEAEHDETYVVPAQASNQGRSTNVLHKRQEQLRRWRESETNKVSPTVRKTNRRVQFQEGDVFLSACTSGDEEEVEQLLSSGADVNTATVDGLTALHQAVIDKNEAMVVFLVERGADLNAQDNEGWTPLHAAGCCGHPTIVEILIDNGADLTVLNSDGELALNLAEDDESRICLEKAYAEQRIDVARCRGMEEERLLADAAEWLRSGVLGDRPHPRTGASALHTAAAKGYIKALNLIVQAGQDVNVRDQDGWTPLHGAAHFGDAQAAEALADFGADFDAVSNAGQTCFDVSDENMVPFLQELKERQASQRRISDVSISSRLSTPDPDSSLPRRKKSVTRMSTDQKHEVAKLDEHKEHKDMVTKGAFPATTGRLGDTISRVEQDLRRSEEEESSNTIKDDEGVFDDSNVSIESEVSPESESTSPETRPATISAKPPTAQSVSAVKRPMSDTQPLTHSPAKQQPLPTWRLTGRTDAASASSSSVYPQQSSPPSAFRHRLDGTTTEQPSSTNTAASVVRSKSDDVTNTKNSPTTTASTVDSTDEQQMSLSPRPVRRDTVFSGLMSLRGRPTVTASPIKHATLQKQQADVKDAKATDGSTTNSGGVFSVQPSKSVQLRSFIQPQQGAVWDEPETERKAKSKRQRESRRSTQGVTMDQLRAAQQIAGNENSDPAADETAATSSRESTENKPDGGAAQRATAVTGTGVRSGGRVVIARTVIITDQPPTTTHSDTPSNTAKCAEQNSVSSPQTESPSSPIVWRSRVLEKATVSPTVSARTFSLPASAGDQQSADNNAEAPLSAAADTPPWNGEQTPIAPSATPSAASMLANANSRPRRSRITRQERRSTGPVTPEQIREAEREEDGRLDTTPLTTITRPSYVDAAADQRKSTTVENGTADVNGTRAPVSRISGKLISSLGGYSNRYPGSSSSGALSSSSIASSRASSAGSLPTQQTTGGPASPVSGSPPPPQTAVKLVTSPVDYKQLYEAERAKNEDLQLRNKDLEARLKRLNIIDPPEYQKNGIDGSRLEDRERRSYERRIAELEEELKCVEPMRADNQRLKDENGALIRVISKLSK